MARFYLYSDRGNRQIDDIGFFDLGLPWSEFITHFKQLSPEEADLLSHVYILDRKDDQGHDIETIYISNLTAREIFGKLITIGE